MKIKCTLMGILMVWGMLAFNACDDNNDKDKTKQLLPLLLLPRTYAIGNTGPSGVGIVFYITNGGLHGLEASPADQSTEAMWSTIADHFASGSSALPAGIGTGSANTDAIILQNSPDTSAAKLCRDYTGGGKTDWFLPSQEELNMLFEQRASVGGLTGSYYWSSSESTQFAAWGQAFPSGTQTEPSKASGAARCVRAVRAF